MKAQAESANLIDVLATEVQMRSNIQIAKEPSHQGQVKVDIGGQKKKCCSSWNPFECSVTDGAWVITVDPEKLRVIFYFEFWSFMFTGVILTVASKGKEFETYYDENLIKKMFGVSNPCIFFDEPPFSYFGAALWVVLLCTMWLYLFVDLKRVCTHKQGESSFSKWFYRIYTAVSIFIALSFVYFIEVFAVQPEQHTVVHWVPFSFLMWSLFLLCLQHFAYMMKTGKGLDHRVRVPCTNKSVFLKWPSRAYVALVFTIVLIKFTTDLINATGAKLWEQPGLNWTKPLSVVNDQLFMVWIMGFPIVIYRYLVDSKQLDTVKFTIETKSADVDA